MVDLSTLIPPGRGVDVGLQLFIPNLSITDHGGLTDVVGTVWVLMEFYANYSMGRAQILHLASEFDFMFK